MRISCVDRDACLVKYPTTPYSALKDNGPQALQALVMLFLQLAKGHSGQCDDLSQMSSG